MLLEENIYGLEQASRQYYLKLKNQLESLGLKRMRRTIMFMQSSRIENSFSTSYV
jgi:hypothetical protein